MIGIVRHDVFAFYLESLSAYLDYPLVFFYKVICGVLKAEGLLSAAVQSTTFSTFSRKTLSFFYIVGWVLRCMTTRPSPYNVNMVISLCVAPLHGPLTWYDERSAQSFDFSCPRTVQNSQKNSAPSLLSNEP